jgi:hypothetical protein
VLKNSLAEKCSEKLCARKPCILSREVVAAPARGILRDGRQPRCQVVLAPIFLTFLHAGGHVHVTAFRGLGPSWGGGWPLSGLVPHAAFTLLPRIHHWSVQLPKRLTRKEETIHAEIALFRKGFSQQIEHCRGHAFKLSAVASPVRSRARGSADLSAERSLDRRRPES